MPAEPAKTHVAKSLTHPSPLIACRFDPTGKYVFTGSEDNLVTRWELESDKKTVFAGHESWVRSIAFDPKGETLITGGYEGRLIWWPARTEDEKPQPIRTVEAHRGFIRAVAVSPDGRLLATCGVDKMVRIWQLESGSLVHELRGHESDVWNVAFHPSGKDLVSGDLKANFIHWEVESGKQVKAFALPSLTKYDTTFMAHIGGPHALDFARDGKLLAIGGVTNVSNAFAGVGNPAIVLFDWEAGKEKITHLSKAAVRGAMWGAAIHPEQFTIGACGSGSGGHLFFWKFDQKDEFFTLSLGNTARDMHLHPDGLQIATAHFDKQLRLSRMAAKA